MHISYIYACVIAVGQLLKPALASLHFFYSFSSRDLSALFCDGSCYILSPPPPSARFLFLPTTYMLLYWLALTPCTGLDDIIRLRELLAAHSLFGLARFQLLVLHSAIAPSEQHRAFDRPPKV